MFCGERGVIGHQRQYQNRALADLCSRGGTTGPAVGPAQSDMQSGRRVRVTPASMLSMRSHIAIDVTLLDFQKN